MATAVQSNGAKAARRARGPHVNSKIIAAADTGNIDVLAQAIEEVFQQMNLVNLTTALHRFAKLHTSHVVSGGIITHGKTLDKVLDALHSSLPRLQCMTPASQGQILSNVMWALMVLHRADVELLSRVVELAGPRLAAAQSSELASLLSSFAALAKLSDAAMERAQAMCRAASGPVQVLVKDFNFKGLVMVVTSFAECGVRDEALFQAAAVAMTKSLSAARGQELAQVARAYGMVGVYVLPFLEDLTRRAAKSVGSLKAQWLVDIAWIVAAAGIWDETFVSAAAGRARVLSLQPNELASLMWSLTCRNPQGAVAESVVSSLLPQCSKKAANFLPADLVSVLTVAARCAATRSGFHCELQHRAQAFFEVAVPCLLERLDLLTGPPFANFVGAVLGAGLVQGQVAVCAQLAAHTEANAWSFSSPVLLSLIRELDVCSDECLAAALPAMVREVTSRLADLTPLELAAAAELCAAKLGREVARTADDVAVALEQLGGRRGGCETDADILAPAAGPVATKAASRVCRAPVNLSISTDFVDESETEATLTSTNSAAAHAPATSSSESWESATSSEAGDSGSREHTTWPRWVVRNSFVELVEQEDPELPPALNIIPQSVSREDVDELRTKNIRLRSGRITPSEAARPMRLFAF